MIFFLDSSALVKRYVAEPGSTRVRQLFTKRRTLAVSRISWAEVAAAAARRHREGTLSSPARDSLMAHLEADFTQFTIVEYRQTTNRLVSALCARHPLRAYDAVQLAHALTLRQVGATIDFLTADLVLGLAARAEGLRSTPL